MVARAVYQQGFDPAMPAGIRIGATGALIVVAAVGDTVAVSGPVQVAGDGTVSFPFTDQPAGDSTVRSTLLVVASPSATTARLINGTGSTIAEVPLIDGVTLVADPGPVAKIDARVGDHISFGTVTVDQPARDLSLVPPSSAGRIN